MEAVQKENLTVDAIFLTHGHGDHIMALAEVAEKTGAPVYISKEDAPMLTDPVRPCGQPCRLYRRGSA